jgi:hypothetical protein
MGRGSIRRRGKHSWQIRFNDGVDAAGRRNARWTTVRDTRQDAQNELTRLLAAADAGTLPALGHAKPRVMLNVYARRHRCCDGNRGCDEGKWLARFVDNPCTVSRFVRTCLHAKSLTRLQGWVAEWFKAPVLKAGSAFPRPSWSISTIAFLSMFAAFSVSRFPSTP